MTGSPIDHTEPTAAGDTGPPFGTFRFVVSTHTMTWSNSLYALYGYVQGAVVPSLELLYAHLHPDDRSQWQQGITHLLATGAPFCRTHRIVDTRHAVRTALTTCTAELDESGQVVAMTGSLIDLSETLRRHNEADVTRAVARSTESRSTIEQAKGLMMASFDLDDEQAFDLLRLYSSSGKVKVRDVAASLVARLVDPELATLPPRQRVAAILAEYREGEAQAPPVQRAIDHPMDIAGQVSEATLGATSLIPTADLPRTLASAIAGAAQSITIADALQADAPLVYVNDAFVELTGYPADEILGRNCRFLQGADTEPAQIAQMHEALQSGLEVRTVLRNYRRDGTPFWNELHMSGVRDGSGRLTHFIGYQIDVSERVERERQLFQLAYFDVLTGLPNEASALLHLGSLISTEGAAELFHIEMSGLRFADAPGNEDVAATVLATAGRRLRAKVRQDDFVAKLDGNAFLVIHRDGGIQDAVEAARAIVNDPIVTSAGHLRVSVRVGSASCPQDSRYPSELIEVAASSAVRVS